MRQEEQMDSAYILGGKLAEVASLDPLDASVRQKKESRGLQIGGLSK